MPRTSSHEGPSGPSAARSSRDVQRSRVYAGEDAWALRLDAARRGATRAEVAGSSVLLPAEQHFGTLAAAQAYCDAHLGDDVPPVRVRSRKGAAQAHWEAPAGIALPVPEHGTPWALRETVLLHEMAHHLAFHLDGKADHGPSYTARMLALVDRVLGPEAALALRVDYAEAGVRGV
jgi:putative metallohydrolase (TIGR04338 family)